MTGRLEAHLLALTFAAGLCALTTLALAATPATTMHHAAAKPGASSKAGAIRQEAVIAASPDRVYAALLDSTEFGAVTGMHAVIEPTVGAAFHNFNGMIEGRNLELVPGQRIVQAWRAYDWPAGVYSIVRFVLTPEGNGTRLVLTHWGYEEGEPRASLEKGWQEHYFVPLQKHFAATP